MLRPGIMHAVIHTIISSFLFMDIVWCVDSLLCIEYFWDLLKCSYVILEWMCEYNIKRSYEKLLLQEKYTFCFFYFVSQRWISKEWIMDTTSDFLIHVMPVCTWILCKELFVPPTPPLSFIQMVRWSLIQGAHPVYLSDGFGRNNSSKSQSRHRHN